RRLVGAIDVYEGGAGSDRMNPRLRARTLEGVQAAQELAQSAARSIRNEAAALVELSTFCEDFTALQKSIIELRTKDANPLPGRLEALATVEGKLDEIGRMLEAVEAGDPAERGRRLNAARGVLVEARAAFAIAGSPGFDCRGTASIEAKRDGDDRLL